MTTFSESGEATAPDPAESTSAAASPPFVERLVEAFKNEGVDAVFGLPGGAVGPLFHHLMLDSDIDMIVARHEAGAVAMADGYARVRRTLGVAVTTSGPGALNALPHLAVAHTDNSPVLLVTGQPSRVHNGRGSFQEGTEDHLNITETFRHCTGYSRELSHSGAADTIVRGALRSALSAPRGAAHLAFPVDMSFEPGGCGVPDLTGGPGRVTSASVPWEAVQRVASELLRAERPLILLGNGAREALADSALLTRLTEICALLALPVATTGKAKGLYPESANEALGVVSTGGSARAHAYTQADRPDAVVVVGSSLGEWSTRRWTAGLAARRYLCHVGLQPQDIGRSYLTHDTILADAGAFLNALVEALQASGPVEGSDDEHAAFVAKRRSVLAGLPALAPVVSEAEMHAVPVKPQAAMAGLRDWITQGSRKNLFLDIGNTTGWFTQYVPICPPNRLFVPLGTASMGWANAAVIGAKVADPEATCAVVSGDGGFLMNAVELATAAHRGIGAVWIVLNDNALNMVRQGMHAAFPDSDTAGVEDFSLGSPDLVLLAQSLGAEAFRVSKADELPTVLDLAETNARRHRRPQFVCIDIDPAEPGPFDDRNEAVNRSFAAEPS
ncbi:thiamine pyrophosphate-binding protein [Streptomyces sp. NPDC087908]|uniref:thiamine pyrophosphate-binding protein n=1 Tax=Streptomyces sp. NPDC087908 TaxID=3365820 RepID=UPI003817B706